MTTAKTAFEKAAAAAAAAQTSGAAAAQKLRDTLFASDSVVDAAIKKQNDDAKAAYAVKKTALVNSEAALDKA